MPRLVSVFSLPDLGLLEEPLFYAAGFPVRIRLVLFGLAGLFAALQLSLPLWARIVVIAAGIVLGALPIKPPLSKLFAKRQQLGEHVYWAPLGSIMVYITLPEAGELVVEVDGEEYDRVRVDGGLTRIEIAGLAPGEHVVRLMLGRKALRELRVYSGEKRVHRARGRARESGAGKAAEREARRQEEEAGERA